MQDEHRNATIRPLGTASLHDTRVAHYLAIPTATVRYWAVGQDRYAPLIAAPKHSPFLLSFLNLVELHILASIRRVHEVKMPSIRRAIQFLKRGARCSADRRYPLLSCNLDTDGVDLFIEKYGSLINISQTGQMAIREVIGAALRRINRDSKGFPIKLYPFTRPGQITDTPAMIVIDPNLSAGRPVPVLDWRFSLLPNATRLANPSMSWCRIASVAMRKSRRPSGASSRSRPEMPVFFLNRNLGKHTIAARFRNEGIKTEVHDYHFQPDAPDKEWIEPVGREGWVAVTRGKNIRHRAAEINAIRKYSSRVIVTRMKHAMGPLMAELLVKKRCRIARFVTKTKAHPLLESLETAQCGHTKSRQSNY